MSAAIDLPTMDPATEPILDDVLAVGPVDAGALSSMEPAVEPHQGALPATDPATAPEGWSVPSTPGLVLGALPATDPATAPGQDLLTSGGEALVINTFGAVLGKHSERLQVRVKKEVVQEAPLFRLRQVLVTSRGVLVSSDALRECARRGIPVHFVGRQPDELMSLTTPVGNATAATRREQLLALSNGRGAACARAFVAAKLRNQAALLKYAGKYRKTADRALYLRLRDAAADLEHLADLAAGTAPAAGGATDLAALRPQLFTLEARGGRGYWEAVAALLAGQLPGWPGREHRGTREPFNAALNYGYAILAAEVHTALLIAGLEPAAGFLHADRAGKVSLVYDAIEEFRQTVVDRPLLGLATRGLSLQLEEDGRLDLWSRRRVAHAVLGRLDTPEPYRGKRHALRAIVGAQAEHLATFLRGERSRYDAYVARW